MTLMYQTVAVPLKMNNFATGGSPPEVNAVWGHGVAKFGNPWFKLNKPVNQSCDISNTHSHLDTSGSSIIGKKVHSPQLEKLHDNPLRY